MTSDPNARFLDMAIALDALTPDERQRVLDILDIQFEGNAGDMAEKLGFLTKAERERIDEKLNSASASSSASTSASRSGSTTTPAATSPPPSTPAPTPTPRKAPQRGTGRTARKGTGAQPRPLDPATLLPMFAGAVGIGIVVGVGILFAIAPQAATAAATDEGGEATSTASADLGKRPAPNQARGQAARRTIRLVEGLQRDSKELEALAALDAFEADHGRVLLVTEARRSLASHCKTLIDGELQRARRMQRKGDRKAGVKILARLLARVPRSLHEPINAQVTRMTARRDSAVDGDDDDDDDEKGPDWAKTDPSTPTPTATPTPGPSPTATPKGADGDDDDDEPSTPTPTPTGKPVAGLATKVAKFVTVQHRFDPLTRHLDVTYPLREAGDVVDFRHRGFDKFDVAFRELVRVSGGRRGLELGASSQRLGRLTHGIHFDGDFTIDLRVWVSAASGRTVMVFLLGAKHGISYGQQLVKVARSGRYRPLTKVIDTTVFKQEREVRLKFAFKSNKLTVTCNGRVTATGTFTKGELKGPFGLLARDVNMQITYLQIQAVVDPSKL